jgi:RHS repeat-associated protein
VICRPFGGEIAVQQPLSLEETKGFIGERFDADAGLQYLNARYYDPKLGLFTQPDWWEVTAPGVGTNRYAYSFNDPVNLNDPGGHIVPIVIAGVCAGGACEALGAGIAGIVAGLYALDATDGKIDGRLDTTSIEPFDLGHESLKPDGSNGPIITGNPIMDDPVPGVEGMSTEAANGPVTLADPYLQDDIGNILTSGPVGSYEIFVVGPDGGSYVYVGKGSEARM